MVRYEVAVKSAAAEFPKLGRIPTVSAKQWGFHSQLLCLLGDDSHFTVIPRNVDDLRIQRAQGGQLTFIIAIALSVRLSGNYLSSQTGETVLKELRQTATIGRIKIKHDCRGFGFQ